MTPSRSQGVDLDGVVVFDKPSGESSNASVQYVKRQFRARKVGHTGSLDPLATGVLPLCLGEATKFSRFLLNAEKRYEAELQFGVSTDSGDADGRVTATRSVEGLTEAGIDRALDRFRGELEQYPPMFSAVKYHGTPLYKLARRGIEIERKPRKITVFSNELKSFSKDTATLSIHCTKGTYVRCIADELGEMLGCGAHVTALRRTMVGPFETEDLVTKKDIEEARNKESMKNLIRPISSILRDWPEVVLGSVTAFHVKNGRPVIVPHAPTSGWVRLSERTDKTAAVFLGVGEILDDGRVAPRRLMTG